MRRKAILLIFGALTMTSVLLTGCGESGGDGLSKDQVQLGQKSDEIIKAANGNWDNLSAEDKAYLIKEIGYGDENNAKMFFNAKSGNLKRASAPTPPSAPGMPTR